MKTLITLILTLGIYSITYSQPEDLIVDEYNKWIGAELLDDFGDVDVEGDFIVVTTNDNFLAYLYVYDNGLVHLQLFRNESKGMNKKGNYYPWRNENYKIIIKTRDNKIHEFNITSEFYNQLSFKKNSPLSKLIVQEKNNVLKFAIYTDSRDNPIHSFRIN